jgi:hypothetical protein
MIPDLQEDFKSVKTWTNVSVVVGSTHTYQHMFEDGCQSMRGYTRLADIPGVPRPVNLDLKEDVLHRPRIPCYPDSIQSRPILPPPRPSDTRVIQIPIQSRPILPHQGLRILVLSRFHTESTILKTQRRNRRTRKCL